MPTRRALKRSLPRAYSLNSSGDMSTEPGHPLPALLRHNAQVVSSRLGDAGVLVHLRSNRIFELNVTGFRVWELIGEGLDLAAVEQRLVNEFAVAPERLQIEVRELVQALLQEGLLDVGAEG
jgi:hypothetical protein